MSAADTTEDPGVTDVRLVSTLDSKGPYDKLWQPFIERWTDERLVIAFGAQVTGKIDMGDILCSVSFDAGDTWSASTRIFDHRAAVGSIRFAYANPVLYRPSGQDLIWCFAMRCPSHYRDSEDGKLCAAYTVDGGLSWQPVEVAVAHHSHLITNAGVVAVDQANARRYLLPVHRHTRRHDRLGTHGQFVLESTSLLDWKLAGYVPQPPDYDVFVHEGNIAPGEVEGELWMVMRTARGSEPGIAMDPPCAFSSRSLDGGRTWSVAEPELDLYNTVAKG